MPINLRDWQKDALTKWRSTNRGVFSVVTGAGKTIFALEATRNFFLTGRKILILVPTQALMDQWLEQIMNTWPVGRNQISLHSASGEINRDSQIHIAVVNTARDLVPTLCGTGENWVLIADECHRYGSPENARAVKGNWLAAVGLSATPVREFDSGFEEYVVPYLGNIIFEYGYLDALRDGVLSPFSLENYRVELNSEETDEFDRLTKVIAIQVSNGVAFEDPNLLQLLFKRASIVQNAEARLPAAFLIYKKFASERGLIFLERIESAEKLSQMLNDSGIKSVLYHSKLSNVERMQNLFSFRKGMVDTLVTCRALDEGFDVPNASFGLIVSSTTSKRQRIQRLGRVLRASPGKSHATVATIYATEAERKTLSDEASTFGDEVKVNWYGIR